MLYDEVRFHFHNGFVAIETCSSNVCQLAARNQSCTRKTKRRSNRLNAFATMGIQRLVSIMKTHDKNKSYIALCILLQNWDEIFASFLR